MSPTQQAVVASFRQPWKPAPEDVPVLDRLWQAGNPSGAPHIAAQDAVPFLSGSGLPKEILRQVCIPNIARAPRSPIHLGAALLGAQIWELSAVPHTMRLGREEFDVSMRYISMAQCGAPVSIPAFLQGIRHRLPPPRIADVDLSGAPMPSPAASPSSTSHAGSTAGTGTGVPPTAFPSMAGVQPAMAPGGGVDPWVVTAESAHKYDVYFLQLTTHEHVEGRAAVDLLKKSGLPQDALRAIWSLADMDQDGRLDRVEFRVAMHLVVCASKRNIPLPSALPPALLATARAPVPVSPAGTPSAQLPQHQPAPGAGPQAGSGDWGAASRAAVPQSTSPPPLSAAGVTPVTGASPASTPQADLLHGAAATASTAPAAVAPAAPASIAAAPSAPAISPLDALSPLGSPATTSAPPVSGTSSAGGAGLVTSSDNTFAGLDPMAPAMVPALNGSAASPSSLYSAPLASQPPNDTGAPPSGPARRGRDFASPPAGASVTSPGAPMGQLYPAADGAGSARPSRAASPAFPGGSGAGNMRSASPALPSAMSSAPPALVPAVRAPVGVPNAGATSAAAAAAGTAALARLAQASTGARTAAEGDAQAAVAALESLVAALRAQAEREEAAAEQAARRAEELRAQRESLQVRCLRVTACRPYVSRATRCAGGTVRVGGAAERCAAAARCA